MDQLVRGHKEFVYDAQDRCYVDAISGVYNVSYGHGLPRIIECISSYILRTSLLNCYDNPTPERSALEKKLRELTCFDEARLLSTGSEAVEKALLLALRSLPSARRGVLHFASGFHGKTMGTYGLFDVEQPVKLPYDHACLAVPGGASEDEVLSLIDSALCRRSYGVVILEPVMSYYGHIFSDAFLRRLRDLCTETQAILIFDEMVTGFGRTGVNFVSDVVKPDILVTGKGLGQGLPISAVLFDNGTVVYADGFSWTTATANNPLLCRVGYESCKILATGTMAGLSEEVGAVLEKKLLQFDPIREVFEIVRKGSMLFLKRRDHKLASVEAFLREKCQILTREHGSTLVLMPPFVTSTDSLQFIATGINRAVLELRDEASTGS